MEVAKKNGRLGAGDDKNQKDEEEKSEHVVHLTGPDRVQNEEELNKDASEWQNTTHHNAWNGLRVNRLIGNLTWNLIRSYWMLECLTKTSFY